MCQYVIGNVMKTIIEMEMLVRPVQLEWYQIHEVQQKQHVI